MSKFDKIYEKVSQKKKKINEKKTTINDLSIDFLKQVINKLSIEEVLRIERVDKRFQYCV